jgi:DNA-binding NarL/FixJ family response regulator
MTRLLHAAGVNVLTALDGQQALTLLHRHGDSIGVVLSDYNMAQMNGAELLRAVCLRWPDVARVLLTGNSDASSFARAVNEGHISGLFLKTSDPAELQREVIRLTEAHRLVRENRALRARIAQIAGHAPGRADVQRRGPPADAPWAAPPPPPPPMAPLTAREVDVLRVLVEGRTNRAISVELGLSPATVKVHVGHIVAKLGARDRTQAAVRATELGLVAPTSRMG